MSIAPVQEKPIDMPTTRTDPRAAADSWSERDAEAPAPRGAGEVAVFDAATACRNIVPQLPKQADSPFAEFRERPDAPAETPRERDVDERDPTRTYTFRV